MIRKLLLIIIIFFSLIFSLGLLYLQNSNNLDDTVKAIKYNIIKPINTVETISMSIEEYYQSYGFTNVSVYYYQKLEKEYSYSNSTYIFTSTRINYFEYNDIVISNKDYRGVGHFNIGLTSKYLDVLVGVYALPIDDLPVKSDVIVCYRFVDEDHVELKEKPILRIEDKDNDEIIDVYRYEIASNIEVENVDISNIIWFGPLNDEGGFQLISFE